LDIKYVLLGVNVIVLGVLMAVYSYLIMSTQLLGVSASIILVGLVVLVLGYSYVEPTTSFLIDYSREVSRFASLVLEDLRLSNILPSTLIRDSRLYLVISNVRPEDSSKLSPGINIVGGEPLLLIPINTMLETNPPSSLYEVESRLRDRLIGEYGLCNSLVVQGGDGGLRLRLIGLDTRLLEIELAPLNPLDIIVLTTLSSVMGKALVFTRRVLEAGEYRAEFQVVQ